MSPGDEGASGNQASADPPQHMADKDVPREMRRGSPNADAQVEGDHAETDDEAELRLRQLRGDTPGPGAARQEAREGPDTQRREAKEPAPGDANPLSEPDGRPLDRRTSSL